MLPARIIILSSDPHASHVQLRLHSKGCQVATMACIDSALGSFYADPPDLLIVDLSNNTECGHRIVSTLRSDSFFSAVPIIGLLTTIDGDSLDWERCPLDDFIGLPPDYNELFSRISLAISRPGEGFGGGRRAEKVGKKLQRQSLCC